MEHDHGGSLAQLTQRLLHNPTIRFFHTMERRYRDIHLKDLLASAMDDQRRLTVQGTTVYNFGSDSFLGLDRDARVQQAILDGVKRWGTHNGRPGRSTASRQTTRRSASSPNGWASKPP